MGGQGGRKKQTSKALTKKVAPKVATITKASTATASKGAAKPSAAGAKRTKGPNVVPVGDAESEYSADEESPATRAMVVDATTKATITSQLKKAGRVRPTPADAGVLYLGHIPHGFYEQEMKGFFSQFGTVSRLRLARNKKTGRSKHYAFIEFKVAEVAEVVAKSMNGYLMFSKVLVAKVLKPEEVHPELFRNANRPFKPVDRTMVARQQHNKVRTEAQASKREGTLLSAEKRKRRKLEVLGIDYEFDGYAAAAQNPKKRLRGVITDQQAGATKALKKAKADALAA